ncbi:MAG TPA: 4-hydroxy-tetrahydrodipicolinate reductase [Phycisphaerales bacterium]|nr:4-hydroxy-tetrahydrodipicolinate reductase [Phycisphaerales bacterium]
MSNLHIAVVGAAGRTGSRIVALAQRDERVTLTGAVVRDSSPLVGSPVDAARPSLRYTALRDTPPPRVVIDFSTPSALADNAAFAARHHAGLVVGTTGLSSDHAEIMRATAAIVPVLHTPNTSIGVAAVARVIADLARTLGPSYSVSIVDIHHVHKKDAPSGTAKRLAASLRAAGASIADDQIESRREGEVVGTHIITLTGPGESVEVIHKATTRDLFALGAIRAAKWLAEKKPGLYTIEDTI